MWMRYGGDRRWEPRLVTYEAACFTKRRWVWYGSFAWEETGWDPLIQLLKMHFYMQNHILLEGTSQ